MTSQGGRQPARASLLDVQRARQDHSPGGQTPAPGTRGASEREETLSATLAIATPSLCLTWTPDPAGLAAPGLPTQDPNSFLNSLPQSLKL